MLMVRGDVVALTLSNGTRIEIPEDWGMIWDPKGRAIPKCTVLFQQYGPSTRRPPTLSSEMAKIAESYFGRTDELVGGTVTIPCGPWIKAGNVSRIEYERQGKHDGPWYHPYKDGAVLYRLRGNRAYKLELGDHCVINDRGFVEP